ncbi:MULTISPECIES: hypothetical protein [Legionella]|uniref:Coiled coil domain-containing protein n=1 Tax=Legionella drozanskii LLAP-1 TaxID=1212489 RepID=A0A0W0SW11_9GAMM|nr:MULTISPECIES: hypothetical protein [Legionella]KTC87575.1 coiled coil domain-containing protein [Legionella drozanskii LLAP-1]PJE11396.1 MAG: hypothetical protein CK430_08990 [Legionella sp.]
MVTKVQTDLSAIKTQEKKKVYEHFIRSLKDSGGLASTNSFNNYDSSRMSAVESFSEVKAPDGKKLSEKLKTVGTPDATTAAQSITTALEQSDNYKDAKKDFNTDLTNLNDLLLAGKYSLGDAASYMLEAKNTAVNAIQAQQTLERDNLSKLFEKDDFKTQMKTALGCSDAELQAIKTQMTADLKKSQDEKLDEFKKGLEDNANQLFKKAEQEYWRISFLGHRYLSNKAMKEEIDRMAAEAEKKDPTLSMHSGIKGSDRLKHIDPTKLTTHVSITGTTLQAGGEGAEFSLSTEFNRWYTTDHRIYVTLTSIAEELKARGSDTITFQINDTDPKRAKEIAKKAFESAIIAGFPPDKINIKVNGESLYSSDYDEKAKKAKVDDKLFTDDPKRLQFAKSKFQKGAEEREAFIKGNNTGKLKAELQDLKAKAREAEKSAAPRLGP